MNAARGSLLQNIWAPSILLLLLVSTSCVSGSYGQSKSTTQGKYYADDLSDKDQDDELFELASKTTNMNINYDVVEKQSNDKTSSKNVKRKSKKSEKLKKRKKKECKVCNTTEMKPMLCRECRKGGNHKCVRYCSRKCQKIDWKSGHRLECEVFKKCNTCGKILKKVASRRSLLCPKAYYCNEKCEMKDWETYIWDSMKLKEQSKAIVTFRWKDSPTALANDLIGKNSYYNVYCDRWVPLLKNITNHWPEIPEAAQNVAETLELSQEYNLKDTFELVPGMWVCKIQLNFKRYDESSIIIGTNGPYVVRIPEGIPFKTITINIDKDWNMQEYEQMGDRGLTNHLNDSQRRTE
eukprot:177607_1